MNSFVFQEVESILFSDYDLKDGTDHPNPTWLQTCPMSLSPLGDSLVLGLGQKVLVLSVHRRSPPKVLDRSVDLEEQHQISSVLCLPLVDSRGAKGHLVWTCCVVGYRSGLVEILTCDHGEALVRRRFYDSPVVSLRSSSTCSQWPKCKAAEAKLIPAINDVLIVYEKSIVALSGSALYKTLFLHKSKLAEARAQGEDIDQLLGNVLGRRLLVREQTVFDVCVVNHPNVTFDQLSQLSMSNKINETHLRSIKHLSNIVTVGVDPFVQFNMPYNYQHQDINELAESVVSTVKSGIFRVATGIIWGNSSSDLQKEEQRKDPEQKLMLSHSFKDQQKLGLLVEKSHNNMYLAVIDNQNRVLVMDALTGVVINVWKGYHHAQIGWVTVASCESTEDFHDSVPLDSKVSCLLAIYLPRRGSLEVCSVERKVKIAEFSVSKTGRLIQVHNAILNSTGSSTYTQTLETCFLDSDGTMLQIVIPLRCITDQSSTSQDLVKQQKFLHLLSSSGIQEKTAELADIIASIKSSVAKISMLIELVRREAMPLHNIKAAVLEYEKLYFEEPYQATTVTLCLQTLKDVMDSFEFFKKTERIYGEQLLRLKDDEEFIRNFSHVTSCPTVLRKFLDAMPDDREVTIIEFSLPLLARWLDLTATSFDAEKVKLSLSPLKSNENMSILKAVGAAATLHVDETCDSLKRLSIQTTDLLKFVTNVFLQGQKNDIVQLGACLQSIFKVVQLSSGNVPLTGLGTQVKHICYSGNISPPLFFFLHQWTEFTSSACVDLHSDCSRSLHLLEAFLIMQTSLKLLQGERTFEAKTRMYTLENVYGQGNGKIPEIIADWLVEWNITAPCFESEKVSNFIGICGSYFPKNIQSTTLRSHLAWEYFHKWNKQRSNIDLLRNGFLFLETLTLSEFPLAHKLCLLVWKTFLDKSVRDAVNVTEIPSASRCLREIGVQESELPSVLQVCAKVARMIVDTDVGSVEPLICKDFYDDISLVKQNHLLDHVATFHVFNNSERMSLQYQFTLVTCLLLKFELTELVKPLSLFSHQEANSFFQGDSSTNLGLFTLGHNHSVRSHRKRLLKQVCSAMVKCIHHLPRDVDGVERLETEEFKDWNSQVIMLGKMWFLSDVVKESVVVALYRENLDSLGHEMLSSMSEKNSVGRELLHVAMLRLTKYIYESDNHSQMLLMVKPGLLSRLSLMQEEAMALCESNLESIKDFLVVLCTLNLDDETMQVACDCLSLVQIFSRSEKKRHK